MAASTSTPPAPGARASASERERIDWRGLRDQIAGVLRGRRDEAEDLLHAAFVRMRDYAARAEVRNPEAFLLRTAVNLGRDEGRRRSRVLARDAGEDWMHSLADEQPLQDEVLAAQERLSRASAGLKRLPARTREVFLMHRIDGLKYRVIAERLGLSQSAVEKHIAKAALFLADWMKEC